MKLTNDSIINAFKLHCENKNSEFIEVTKFDGSDRSEASVKCKYCSTTRTGYLLRQARNKKALSTCNLSSCVMERKSIKQRMSEDELFSRINESSRIKNVRSNPYLPFEYKNFISLQTTRYNGICVLCGNEVQPLLNNFLDSSSGCCDNCSTSGFNKNEIGYLYIIYVYDEYHEREGEINAIKVGITNNLAQRYNNQTNKSKISNKTFINVWEASGKDIYNIEKSVKCFFKKHSSYLDKMEYPDGYTETYCDSLHHSIEEYINVWVDHINSTVDINDENSYLVYEYSPDEINEEFGFDMHPFEYDIC